MGKMKILNKVKCVYCKGSGDSGDYHKSMCTSCQGRGYNIEQIIDIKYKDPKELPFKLDDLDGWWILTANKDGGNDFMYVENAFNDDKEQRIYTVGCQILSRKEFYDKVEQWCYAFVPNRKTKKWTFLKN